METITVEAVGKFGPKANGRWYGVARDLRDFKFLKDAQYSVTTEPWEKNGKSGVNIVDIKNIPQLNSATQTHVTSSGAPTTNFSNHPVVNTYETDKQKRILVQGIVQAVLQSPALSGLQYSSLNDLGQLVEELSSRMIEFVVNKSK